MFRWKAACLGYALEIRNQEGDGASDHDCRFILDTSDVSSVCADTFPLQACFEGKKTSQWKDDGTAYQKDENESAQDTTQQNTVTDERNGETTQQDVEAPRDGTTTQEEITTHAEATTL